MSRPRFLLDEPVRVWVSCLVAVLLSGPTLFVNAGASPTSLQRGASLFAGREAVSGRIRGHEFALPARVVRCANCHASAMIAAPQGATAPRLDARFLTTARARRGGPPTAYDQQSFCRALRDAVDPGFIILAREMPVYQIDDSQCASLWLFLTEGSRHDGAH